MIGNVLNHTLEVKMLYLILYLLDLVETLDFLSSIFIGLTIFVPLFYFIGYKIRLHDNSYLNPSNVANIKNEFKAVVKYVTKKSFSIPYSILLILALLMPQSNTVKLMVGLYLGQQTIEVVKDSPLFDKAYKLAELKLDELLTKEITETKKD